MFTMQGLQGNLFICKIITRVMNQARAKAQAPGIYIPLLVCQQLRSNYKQLGGPNLSSLGVDLPLLSVWVFSLDKDYVIEG